MKVKETIAFIGEADSTCEQLVRKLVAESYPVVLVTKEGNHFAELSGQLLNNMPEADIEVVGCEKEGCWEADVIFLCCSATLEAGLTEKIREVAIQKILVCCSSEGEQSVLAEKINGFRQSLPHTRCMRAIFYTGGSEVQIGGADEAIALIENVFNEVGYTTRRLKTAV